MKLCLNPGITYDWSVQDDKGMPIASSDDGPFESARLSADSFDVIVEMAKADVIPFGSEKWSETEYSYDWDGDLYFIKDYITVDELRKDFDKVINFLKEQ